MKSSVKKCPEYPSHRILTQGRLAAALLGLCVFSADSTAEVVERYNASGTLTASGTDVATVQEEAGAAEGDVIVISGTATHNSGIAQTLESFTIRSAQAGVKQTINAGNTRLYNFNNGVHTYNIKFQDLDYQGSVNPVSNAIGLFMHTSPALTLNINADNVSFTGFKAETHHGGVFGLDGDGSLNITAVNGIVFDSNRTNASTGGAIHVNAGSLSISGDSLTFRNNYAQKFGGAIYTKASASITGNSVLFENNSVANNDGGAIQAAGALALRGLNSESVFTVRNNYAKYLGGAITSGALTFETGTFNFTGNYNTTSSASYSYGGAVNCSSLTADAKVINFDSNTSRYYGGGLSVKGGSAVLQAETITFSNNTASNFGGAVYVSENLTFTGEGTAGTFKNNSAGNGNGNDLYLAGASSVLTFQESGTYSFDGGIILAGESARTVIDKAQVTVAGRENDVLNNYQFRNVTLSNGGKLTVDLDEIDSFAGVFNVGTADTAGTLELNVGKETIKSLTFSDSLKISGTGSGNVAKTGEGTLQVDASQDSLDVEELTVSSGRLDLQGSMTGGLTVGTNAVFSPGNAVGEAAVGGAFTLDPDAVLLLEQDASGMDLLKAESFDVDPGFIELEIGLVLPNQTYPIIQNTSGDFGADQDADFWTSLLTQESANYWDLSVLGNTVYATIDGNAVPEPSAWMLLLLGSFGLLYWRKK